MTDEKLFPTLAHEILGSIKTTGKNMPSPETSLPPLVLLPVVRKTAPDESCVHNAITYIYTHNPTLISKIAECERLSNDEANYEANYPVARKILDELIQYLRDVVSSHVEIADAIVLTKLQFEIRRHVRFMHGMPVD